MNPGAAFKKETSCTRSLGQACLCLCVLLAPRVLFAGVDNILEAIRQSEFRFARSAGEVPFMPLGWVGYRFYPDTEFKDRDASLPPTKAAERTFSLGGVVPVHVAMRDMFLLGGDVARDNLTVRSTSYRDQHIVQLVPVAAWMHQYGRSETLGAFVAPLLTKERIADQPWAVNGYAGMIGIHWSSDTLQWVYGGVYQYSFGANMLYPYMGLLWYPTPKTSLFAVFPWPTVSYTPEPGWLLQLGISPGGSSWVRRGDGFESVQSLGSWNLTAGAARRLSGPFWLFVGAGITGFRGVTINLGGDEIRLEAQPSPVYTVAIQFRP